MNTLYLKNGEPYLYSSDEPLTPDMAEHWAKTFAGWREGRMLVADGPLDIRHVDAPPADFGQQSTALMAEFDPGWPTALVCFVGFAFALIGFVAGIAFGT